MVKKATKLKLSCEKSLPGFDSENESDVSEDQCESDRETTVNAQSKPSDVKEGRTVFVRNIPFDSTEADVQRLFEPFGVVDVCKLVIDRHTDTSAGKAFVKFETISACQECLKSCSELSLGGRPLQVCLAVSRQEAHNLLKEKQSNVGDSKIEKKKKLGSRNLHLAREGLVRAGTRDAVGLSAADLAKRQALEANKRIKLRNPDIFVSPVRLCVRNLSSRVDDRTLRGVMRNAAADGTAWVTECRIMRDLTRLSADGVGKSRGYAFVTFREHRHALAALRSLNNTAPVSLPGHGNGKDSPGRRLIVEFSLENRLALEAKKHRAERAQQKAAILRGDDVGIKRTAGGSVTADYLQRVVASDASHPHQKNRKRALSSHTGPKIRHKARPGQVVTTKRPSGRISRAEYRRQRAKERGFVASDELTTPTASAQIKKRKKRTA